MGKCFFDIIKLVCVLTDERLTGKVFMVRSTGSEVRLTGFEPWTSVIAGVRSGHIQRYFVAVCNEGSDRMGGFHITHLVLVWPLLFEESL